MTNCSIYPAICNRDREEPHDLPAYVIAMMTIHEAETYSKYTDPTPPIVKDHPDMAVTLVSNHDTQPLQSPESVVESWFKPLAYAIILLRRGGYPCVFFPDYDGADYRGVGKDGNQYDIQMPSHKWLIDHFLGVRRTHAFKEQNDCFDHQNCIGWTRTGNAEHPGGMAVLLSNDADGTKSMITGWPRVAYRDIAEQITEQELCVSFPLMYFEELPLQG